MHMFLSEHEKQVHQADGCNSYTSEGWTLLLLDCTPWKINIEPENDGLEDDFPFQLGGF